MGRVRTLLVVLVFGAGASATAAQTPTPQTGAQCVEKPFQDTTHLDIEINESGFARAIFSMRLPSTASMIQQISVRVGGSTMGSGFQLLNLTAAIRLNNMTIEHGVDVPNNPFLQSFSLPATLSRSVVFYADASSTAVLQADFRARPQDGAGVDMSIVGITRTDSCSVIP